MKLPKPYKDRLILITDSINYVVKNNTSHLPDKICNIMTNIKLLEFEVEKLKELNLTNKTKDGNTK